MATTTKKNAQRSRTQPKRRWEYYLRSNVFNYRISYQILGLELAMCASCTTNRLKWKHPALCGIFVQSSGEQFTNDPTEEKQTKKNEPNERSKEKRRRRRRQHQIFQTRKMLTWQLIWRLISLNDNVWVENCNWKCLRRNIQFSFTSN